MQTKSIWKLRCPDCGERYIVAHGEAMPNFCRQCGADFRVEPGEFVPKAPAIRTDQTRANDYVYRKLEADSEARAEAALPAIEQQLRDAGIAPDEAQRMAAQQASEIKVTNMRDNMREGDVAAMPSLAGNVVAQTAQAYKEALGFDYFQGGIAQANAPAAPLNESGGKVMQAIQGGAWRSKAPTANARVAGLNGGFGKAG